MCVNVFEIPDILHDFNLIYLTYQSVYGRRAISLYYLHDNPYMNVR